MTDTDSTSQKIEDFKYVYKAVINPYTNRAVDEVIDALFENVKCNYEQYKDDIQAIPATMETYKYHLIKPIDNGNPRYPLLDFLINRAISNLDGIKTDEDLEKSIYSDRKLQLDTTAYTIYNKYSNDALLSKARQKNLLKETGKVLYSYDYIDSGTLHTSLRNKKPNELTPTTKLGNLINGLNKIYFRIQDFNEVNKAVKNYDCNDFSKVPFDSEILALTAEEYYSTKFANMFGKENEEMYKPLVSAYIEKSKDTEGRKLIVCTPNSLNRFAGGGRFIYHLENLVSKPAMFSSMFFGTDEAIKEFSINYKDCIEEVLNIFGERVSEDLLAMPDKKLKILLINACNMTKTDIPEKNEQRYKCQIALDRIFVNAYKKAHELQIISDKEFEEICRESSKISPIITDNNMSKSQDSKAKAEYKELLRKIKESDKCKVTELIKNSEKDEELEVM